MSKDLQQPQQSEEVDLGQLFKLIGNAFDRLFKFIGSILNKLFLAFVWFVFFLKKHIVKIAIAGIAGFGLGYVKERLATPIYKSSAIIKQNYNTGENLYEAIEYYNKLVEEKDTAAIARVLNIDLAKSGKIVGFEAEAVTTENVRIENYDEYIKNLDSVVASTITYKDYLENSKEFELPYQRISLNSKSNESYDNVITEIINKIKNTPYFINEQRKDIEAFTGRENAIKTSLEKGDTLQSLYKEVLKMSVENKTDSQTSITIDNTEDKGITKEYELYVNDLQLRRELVDIERSKEEKANIIEIISIKKDKGIIDNKSTLFGLTMGKSTKLAILLSFLMFMALLAVEFLNYLERFRDKV